MLTYFYSSTFIVQELCESRGGRPELPSLISLRFLGRKATLNHPLKRKHGNRLYNTPRAPHARTQPETHITSKPLQRLPLGPSNPLMQSKPGEIGRENQQVIQCSGVMTQFATATRA